MKNEEKFKALYGFIEQNRPNIAQIAIRQSGETVWSAQWRGFTQEDCVHVMSVTKSVVSLLVGIAGDRGYIRSIDDPVLAYFPDYTVRRGERTIQQITIRHLLTMTAPWKYKSEPWTKVCTSPDWTVAALDLLGGRAGRTGAFRYTTLGVQILCGLIEKVSGANPLDFANACLFAPLGIVPRRTFVADTAEKHREFMISKAPREKIWFVDPRDVPTAGYGLCLSADEMAKIGQMCLNSGVYAGRQIVSDAWMQESTSVRLSCDGLFRESKYGFLWWIIDEKSHAYAALGNSGNAIYINPALDLTVAVAATFKPAVPDIIRLIQSEIEPCILM